MAKQVKRNTTKAKEEKNATQAELVRAAMRLNITTKSSICERTGLRLWELNEIFAADVGLFSEFCIMRRTLADTAADNLEEILKDKSHPQHFAATKYVLQTYKTDLDANLDAKKTDEVEVNFRNDGVNPINITFGKK